MGWLGHSCNAGMLLLPAMTREGDHALAHGCDAVVQLRERRPERRRGAGLAAAGAAPRASAARARAHAGVAAVRHQLGALP